MTRGWTKLYDEFHNSYSSPDMFNIIISERIMWALQMEYIEDMKKSQKCLAINPEENRYFGRSKCRWEHNIKIAPK
jgi:hypothetical protein